MTDPADEPRWDDADRAGFELGDDALEVNELSWAEVGDALWLATLAGGDWRRNTTPSSAPETKPASTGPAAAASPSAHRPDPAYRPTQSADPPAQQRRFETVHLAPDEFDVALTTETADALHFPGALEIIRALRPFKRKVRSWDDESLDEEATAEQAAHDGLWLPVTKAGTARWLDLTVVVDAGPSMALWHATTTAFVALLEQLGAFRTIQVRLLDTHQRNPGSPAVPVLRGGTPETPSRGPAELLDPPGRRIMMVLTDAIGDSWQQRLVSPMLAQWGAAMPVAIVHLLPQRMWQRGGLALRPARVTVPSPLRPNRKWTLDLTGSWLDTDPAPLAGSVVPIPVLQLDARWLRWWSRLITGEHHGPADAMVLLAGSGSSQTPEEELTTNEETSATEQVRQFFSVASPPASRLATLLAAVPVSVPMARVVQAELVPESGAEHLAEVLSSGLLRPAKHSARGRAWDTLTFDFPNTVREVLLSGARRSETAQVVQVATKRFGDQIGVLSRIRSALEEPDTTPDPELTPATAQDVALERMLMRALSGPYLSRADRLRTMEREAPSARTVPYVNESGNNTMADVANRTERTDESTLQAENIPHQTGPRTRPDIGINVGTKPSNPPGHGDEPPAVWGNVPPKNPNFTGRADLLDQLGKRLVAGTTAILPSALHGLGGIGKTQMATEYIYQHSRDYDLVWWIQASQSSQIRQGLIELSQHLKLPGSSETNTAVPAVLEALRIGKPYRRWLLVFDSAESPEMVRPFFPTNGPGEILITSRNSDWAAVARPLEIAVFNRKESKALLQRRGPEISENEADELAEKLGDLPLAIEQAATWRAQTGMPVREYLRLFDEKVAEILDTSAPTDYELSVAAAWNVSFDQLRSLDPAAHQLLQICAFFAPEPISRNFFTGVRGIKILPQLDAALADPMELGRAIRNINRYGLAKVDHRNNTLVMHRLVQAVLRNRMTLENRLRMRHGAHLLLANLDPNEPASSKQWGRYLKILPHAVTAEVVDCENTWVRKLAMNLMQFLYQWGDHGEAIKLAEKAYTHWKDKLGEDDSLTLAAAGQLSFFYWVTGKYAEGSILNERTLELRRLTSGENSEETLVAQNAVGRDLKARGDFAAAKEVSGAVYEKARRLFGDDDPQTLTAARIHGISLRLCGEYQQAAALDGECYSRHVEILGHDNAATLSAYSGLILDRREAGDYLWARTAHEELAKRAQQFFGDDNAETLRRYAYLAVAQRKAGDIAAALKLSGRMLGRFRARYDMNNFNALACALGHSIDLRRAGDLREAQSLGEKTLERYRRNLGEQHPHTWAAAVDLAVTLRLTGDVPAARQLDERAYEQLCSSLWPDHPHPIACAINLASDLATGGNAQAALELETEALEQSVRMLGDQHPTTLNARLNRALDLRAVGRTNESESAFTEVLAHYQLKVGAEHPATKAAAAGVRMDCDIDPLPL